MNAYRFTLAFPDQPGLESLTLTVGVAGTLDLGPWLDKSSLRSIVLKTLFTAGSQDGAVWEHLGWVEGELIREYVPQPNIPDFYAAVWASTITFLSEEGVHQRLTMDPQNAALLEDDHAY